MAERVWIRSDEVKVGDVLPDPHFSGRPGVVTEVAPAWYGCAIRYDYDGSSCLSAVWDRDVLTAVGMRRAGIEVER